MPDIWNFTLLLGAGFFCISLKIFLSFVLECSEVTWKQWSFQILLLSCVRQYHFALLHCWGRTLLSTLAVGTGTVLDFCVLWVVCPLILFGGSFTVRGWFSSHICSDKYSAKDFRDTLCRSLDLSEQLSLRCSAVYMKVTLLSPD